MYMPGCTRYHLNPGYEEKGRPDTGSPLIRHQRREEKGDGKLLKSELLRIIANGENSGVEFKRDDIRPEQLAKEVVALANHQGGIILPGVEMDGTISGINRDDIEPWIIDTVFARYIHPMILPFYETV